VSDDQLASADIDVLAEAWTTAWTEAGGFSSCCTGDVGYEDPFAQIPLEGVDALEGHARRLHAAFPDVRVERTAPALVRGDHACVPWRLLGTQRGELAMLPATDQFVTLHGLHYMELSDGRVRRARGFVDLYDGATQLGLLPQKGGLGESALLMLRGFGLRR
jgi:predicted ester cyclase